VVVAGETEIDPLVATEPTPLSMITLVAPEVLQLSTDEPPAVIVAGFAVKLLIVGGFALTKTDALAVFVPPGPVAVSV